MAPRQLVRPPAYERILAVLAGGLLVVALVLPWDTTESRISATAMSGALLAGSVALATTRWEAQGPFLVGVGVFLVHSVAAPYVASVEETYGIEILREDGKRLSLGGLVYRYPPSPGGARAARAARQATSVREWKAAHEAMPLPAGARPWTTDPRWDFLGWVLLGLLGTPALSVGLAAL